MRWLLGVMCLCGQTLFALTLQEAEDAALQNHPQIRAAEELIERARQGRLEAVSKWLPNLSVVSQAFLSQKPLKFFKLNQPSAFFTQVSMTQALFSSDLYRNVRIAALVKEQFGEMMKAAKNDILFQTRVLYYLVALDRKKVAMAQEHIDLLQLLKERMEGKYLIGEAIAYNVNQAKVAVANVTNDYYDALKNLKNHEDELAQALGIDPANNPYTFLQDEIEDVAIPEISSEEWIVLADENRPDIQLSKTVLAVAQEQVKKGRGEYWPTVTFLGGYGGGSTPFLEIPTTRFNNQFFQWAFGISLNWTLFDGLGRERRINKARADARATKFDVQKVSQAAHTDVRSQLYKIEDAAVRVRSASETLALATETLELAISQLDIGYITVFDYMISVDGLIRAKTAFDQSRFELTAAYYALLHSCGKGKYE